MMDPTGLFPKGFHPIRTKLTPDANSKAKHIQRSSLETLPRYYFIDFGLSVKFYASDSFPRAIPVRAGDRTAPELQETDWETPLDPFPTDIYYIGNVVRYMLPSVSLSGTLIITHHLTKAVVVGTYTSAEVFRSSDY